MPINNPSYVESRDEGVLVAVRTAMNFVGAGVVVTDDPTNGEVEVTIAGGGGGGDFMADGSVPLTGDIDFAGNYQCHDLQAPAALGEAIRQTAKITEASMEDAADKKHSSGGDTTLGTMAGDINLGAYRLLFSQGLIKTYSTDILQIRNVGDSAYASLLLQSLYVNSAIYLYANGAILASKNTDDNYAIIQARDNGVGLAEIARLVGAADPYLQATLPFRLLPIATASLPATPVEGMIAYDDTLNKLVVYTGAAWIPWIVAADLHTQNTDTDLNATFEATFFKHSELNAKGDLISASADDTPSILSVGANDTKLVAASGETTGLKWASEVVTITFVIDGGGTAITTGQKGHLEIPFACTITAWTLMADVAGAIVVDVWKDTYANFPPTDADAMSGAGKEPTIAATNQKAQDTDVTDWTDYTIDAGDILAFNVDSCTTITRVTLSLKCTKNY